MSKTAKAKTTHAKTTTVRLPGQSTNKSRKPPSPKKEKED